MMDPGPALVTAHGLRMVPALVTALLLAGLPGGGGAGCSFPGPWEGAWHHLMHPAPINISAGSIDTKGTCHEVVTTEYSTANRTGFGQFILREESGCLKCMMIYQKHYNVLQYREGECLAPGPPSAPDARCQEIPGDAAMYTMIRVGGRPVGCPLQGPYSLAYGKGGADRQCSHPPSLMDTCKDDSVIQVKYQACPDVEGSESLVERMTCVAKWKEGNKRYFVALVSSRHTVRREPRDRYHCFLYEDISTNMRMAQGQFTSSCRGLWSVLEGRRTFSLHKLSRSPGCRLPAFLVPWPRWGSLSGGLGLHLLPGPALALLRPGTTLERAVCHSALHRPGQATLVLHVKQGCSSGYMCLNLTAVGPHLVRATHGGRQAGGTSPGLRANHPDDACSLDYFPAASASSLLVAEGSSSPCPLSGGYSVEGRLGGRPSCGGGSIRAGCSNSHRLEVTTRCGQGAASTTALVCHGTVPSPPGTGLVVSSGGAYLCLAYTEREGRMEAALTAGRCLLTDPAANISSSGPCILPLTGPEGSPAGPAAAAASADVLLSPTALLLLLGLLGAAAA